LEEEGGSGEVRKYARRRRRNYAEDAEKKYESESALMSADVDDLDALKLAWFFLRLLRNFCAFCVHISEFVFLTISKPH
jgi:hypothetical protein